MRFKFSSIVLASTIILASACTGGSKETVAVASPVQPSAEQILLTGSLNYKQRIALPDESIAVVELKDSATGNVLAEERINLQGRQVPVPFELLVDKADLKNSRNVQLIGAIVNESRPAWVSQPVRITQEARQDIGLVNVTPYVALTADEYQCGDKVASFSANGNVADLTVANITYAMKPVKAASGAKYVAYAEPTTTFWTKGDSATLTVLKEKQPACTKIAPVQKIAEATNAQMDIREKEWKLQDLNRTGVVDNSNITLTLNNTGRLSGNSGCNMYSGIYEMNNTGIKVKPNMVSTMRACIAEAMMKQEGDYRALLAEVTKYSVTEEGLLVLSTADGRTLTFAQE